MDRDKNKFGRIVIDGDGDIIFEDFVFEDFDLTSMACEALHFAFHTVKEAYESAQRRASSDRFSRIEALCAEQEDGNEEAE